MPAAGRYLLTPRYSNADRQSGHLYNADAIDRHLVERCDDGPALELIFPFTRDWASRRTVFYPVDIPAGGSAS